MNHPTWPVYTFQVNTNTPMLYSWNMPVTTVSGPQYGSCNQPSEEIPLPFTRSTWLCTLLPGFQFIRGAGANPTMPGYPPPTTFTLYGQQATYVKNTYITGSPDDVLILVS